MTKKITKEEITEEIIKRCGSPEDFCFEYINGASWASDIRRMREYVRHANRVEREFKKKYDK
jgi:hypothetical protein